MTKVSKLVKEEPEKVPGIMIGFAEAAESLAQNCRDLSIDLNARIDELETEDE